MSIRLFCLLYRRFRICSFGRCAKHSKIRENILVKPETPIYTCFVRYSWESPLRFECQEINYCWQHISQNCKGMCPCYEYCNLILIKTSFRSCNFLKGLSGSDISFFLLFLRKKKTLWIRKITAPAVYCPQYPRYTNLSCIAWCCRTDYVRCY